MSKSTSIPIVHCYRFSRFMNVACFASATIYVLVVTYNILPASNIILFILCAISYAIFVQHPKSDMITHLNLVEGECGVGEVLNDVNVPMQETLVLCEALCRYTQFGCWLAFTNTPHESNIKKTVYCKSLGKYKWVFVPSFMLQESHYKSICRHLIWHTS